MYIEHGMVKTAAARLASRTRRDRCSE